MARSWPEYLEELSNYLDVLRHALAVGFSSVPRVPERPSGPVPEDCVDRIATLQRECESLMVQMSDHLAGLEKRVAVSPTSPHVSRSATYIETDL